jgi:hypothetical protein
LTDSRIVGCLLWLQRGPPVVAPPATVPDRVAQVVAAGEVELAIAPTPTLASAKGVELVGLLPAELQNWFVNTAGVSAAANNQTPQRP